MTDPRINAELQFCNIEAHAMHQKAVNDAANQNRAFSWMYWQWNKSFTSWERVRNEPSRMEVA